MSFSDRLRQAWPRLAAAASVMGSLVWLLWPEKGWHAEGEPSFVLAGAVCAWLFFELIGPSDASPRNDNPTTPIREPHSSDITLYERFNATFGEADRRFLREHDFRMPFDSAFLDGLETVSEWAGADFEFHDGDLQTAFSRFKLRASELLRLGGRYLYGLDNNPQMVSPLLDTDRARGLSDQTQGHIDELNEAGRRMLADLDVFIRLARERVVR